MSIHFDIAAALILFSILLTAGLRKLTRGSTNRTILAAVGMSFMATIFDILSVTTNGILGIRGLQYFANGFYLFFHVLSSTTYLFYLISVADTWHKLRGNVAAVIALAVPLTVFSFLLFTSGYTGLIFSIDGGGNYCRGSMFWLNYLISGLYLLLSCIHMIRYRHLFSRQILAIIITPYPILLIAIVIQYLMPHLLVEMLADALALLLVWFNLQRPEELLDPVTGLGNRTTYHTNVKRAFALQKPLYILRIEIKKIHEMQEAYGMDASNPLIRRVADIITECNKKCGSHADITHNSERVYFMLIKERYFSTAYNLGYMLAEKLQFNYVYAQTEHAIHSYLCLYRIPQDVNDYSKIGNLGNLFVNDDLKPDTFYTAERLFCEKKFRLRVDINQIIERAVKNDSFELYYQPIYSFEKHKFVGAEALLRLYDEQFGFVPPDYLVTAAEEYRMMYLVDDIVMNKALKMLAEKHPEKYGLKFLDINLSMHQCRQENLAERIEEYIAKYRVPPRMLNLEITETAAAYMSETCMQNFRKLRNDGVRFSVDDFGKGYSNIRQIVTFPLDVVKLDQSLSAVQDDASLRALAANVISMMEGMNYQTVIEGVETEEQANIFESLGCDYCQGYYFAKPMNEEKFIEFLTAHSGESAEG